MNGSSRPFILLTLWTASLIQFILVQSRQFENQQEHVVVEIVHIPFRWMVSVAFVWMLGACGAFTLLFGHQEERPACKN